MFEMTTLNWAIAMNIQSGLVGAIDGKFDANDIAFNSVRLCHDANQDGVSQAGELHTFAEQGIAGIKVTDTAGNVNLGGGKTQTFSGSFTRTNGTLGASGVVEVTGSLLLASHSFYRQFSDDSTLATGVQAMPEVQGKAEDYAVNLVAFCAYQSVATGKFDCKNSAINTTKQRLRGRCDQTVKPLTHASFGLSRSSREKRGTCSIEHSQFTLLFGNIHEAKK